MANHNPASDGTDFQSIVGEQPQMETEALYSRAVDEDSDLENDASILRWPTLISVAQRSAHCRHSTL